uniref:F5/8 type C domain-containing protein n=1 Tax=Macrostomum lignano TaxID=282301 RepID=A0A1I8JJD0_9PLAT
RLYLENCAQRSDSGHCSLAIDNQIIQEWTQCSSTAVEPHPCRSFPCDTFTDYIDLTSDRKDSVMSLCEVEVYGKALAFQELENGAA